MVIALRIDGDGVHAHLVELDGQGERLVRGVVDGYLVPASGAFDELAAAFVPGARIETALKFSGTVVGR